MHSCLALFPTECSTTIKCINVNISSLKSLESIYLEYLESFGYHIDLWYSQHCYTINEKARQILLCEDISHGTIPDTETYGPCGIIFIRDRFKSLTVHDYQKIIDIVHLIEVLVFDDHESGIPLDINVRELFKENRNHLSNIDVAINNSTIVQLT